MKFTYEFPVVYLDPDDYEIAEVEQKEARLKPVNLEKEPYEAEIEALGYSFHIIFGSQINGGFLCIPNWNYGCELGSLSDIDWNLHSILHNDFDVLMYEEATAIAYGLAYIQKHFSVII